MHVILLKAIYWMSMSSHENLSIRLVSILSFSQLPSFRYRFGQYLLREREIRFIVSARCTNTLTMDCFPKLPNFQACIGARKIAPDENCPPALILTLILNQTLTLTGGQFSGHPLTKISKLAWNFLLTSYYMKSSLLILTFTTHQYYYLPKFIARICVTDNLSPNNLF